MSKQLLRSMLFMLAIAATTIAPAMGQTTLAGTGTATNPYLISSAADWKSALRAEITQIETNQTKK